jgi:hypothetical protein
MLSILCLGGLLLKRERGSLNFRAEAFSVTFKYFCYFQMGFVTFILGLSLFCYFHFGTFVFMGLSKSFCYFHFGVFIFFFKRTAQHPAQLKDQHHRVSASRGAAQQTIE